MGTENEANNKKKSKNKKLLKKSNNEKKQKSNFQNQNNNPNLHKLISIPNQDNENEEIDEFKRKLQLDSIHAKHITKIKPQFTQRWLEDIM